MAALASVFSITVLTSEGKLLQEIQNLLGFDRIQGPVLPNTIDESLYLAKSKVDIVMSNPGQGSGTPILDPYSAVLPFNNGEFIVTMLGIALIGTLLALPFFLKSYHYSKMIRKSG
jgi:hypothetical protein